MVSSAIAPMIDRYSSIGSLDVTNKYLRVKVMEKDLLNDMCDLKIYAPTYL